MLIAFERRDEKADRFVAGAVAGNHDLHVSTATVAEVWRGGTRSARIARLLAFCVLEPVDEALAKRAGVLLSCAGSSNTIDGIVVATAAARRAGVVTAHLADVKPLGDVAGVDVRAF